MVEILNKLNKRLLDTCIINDKLNSISNICSRISLNKYEDDIKGYFITKVKISNGKAKYETIENKNINNLIDIYVNLHFKVAKKYREVELKELETGISEHRKVLIKLIDKRDNLKRLLHSV